MDALQVPAIPLASDIAALRVAAIRHPMGRGDPTLWGDSIEQEKTPLTAVEAAEQAEG